MPKETLDDAERFLLEHWEESRELEKAMESVREKYKRLNERVVDAVQRKYRELDLAKVYVTQFWGPGNLGVGKSSWPSEDSGLPTGLWFENIRLETLADDEAEAPHAELWISEKTARKFGVDLAGARERVLAAAKKLFPKEDINDALDGYDPGVLWATPLSSKAELLRQFGQADGAGFVKTMVSCVEQFYPLFVVIDEIFAASKPGKQGIK